MTQISDFFYSADQLKLYFQANIPTTSKATIVFVHGTGEHIGRYEDVFQFFAEQGYSCFGFDLRGFGRSEGKRGHVKNFADYVEDLNKFIDEIVRPQTQQPIFVFGHSMGTIVVLNYAAKYAGKIQGVLISSCPVKLVAFVANLGCFLGKFGLGSLASTLTVPNCIDPQTLSDNQANIQAFIKDPQAFNKVTFSWLREFKLARTQALAEADRIQLPILINHGDADEIADLEGVEQLFQEIAAQDKTLYVYPGLKHELLNHTQEKREEVLMQTLEWLNQHTKLK